MTIHGLTIRSAEANDSRDVASVHIQSSEDAYAPLAKAWPAPDFADREAQWRTRFQTESGDANRVDLVAELDGCVVGFASAGSARRANESAEVEVYVIHALPAHRGNGIGRLLWKEACGRVRGKELRAMYVDTLGELRCCSFYEAHGGQVAQRHPREFHGGAVTEVVYIWPPGHSSELHAKPAAESPG
jgi:GNAT superfamily N-acetyltransferase